MKRRNIDNELLLGEVCALLSQGKGVKIRAKGDSMRPFIHGAEDILVLAPAAVLHRGDVVLARVGGTGYVVHRIVAMSGDRITLMGDGNLYMTEQCVRRDIYGTVESVIRDGKERKITRLSGMAWRSILPLRRLKAGISNMIRRI